ncbi:hypothetical protein ACCD06_01630 [Azospirillum sp. CT11-132]|uniref:hypothetical protein n=1 Tax=Azospirillum sp. CT11-132 TaxID=3396317 RepID=UPI0039A4FA12
MAVPFILAGAALLAGGFGIKKGIDAKRDFSEASDTNDNANQIVENAQRSLNLVRQQTQDRIEGLGKAKLKAYKTALIPFVEAFKQLKNVDFQERAVNGEVKLTKASFAELEAASGYMSPILLSGISSLGAGGLAGLAAFGGAGAFAAASTGTPIAVLSGAAATNATLAWFGGGALSAGGLGMAGGTAILGGIVAGPVLAVGGMMLASKAEAAKHAAYENLAKARAAAEEMKGAEVMAKGIGTSFAQVRVVLEDLLVRFNPLLTGLQAAVAHSTDYRTHTEETRKGIMMTAALASTIRNVIDKRLLTDEGTIIQEALGEIEHLRSSAAAQRSVS